LPFVLRYQLLDHLLRPITHGADQHLVLPLGTPDDLGGHKVDGVFQIRLLDGDIIAVLNSAAKPEGPFIPGSSPEAFWPMACNPRAKVILGLWIWIAVCGVGAPPRRVAHWRQWRH